MKIAICDDYPRTQQELIASLKAHKPTWKISIFKSGEDLIRTISEENYFDLIFLDIYMDKLNGIETAKALRNLSCYTAIIFTTTTRDFAVESYQVEALSYLVKPISERDLLIALARFEKHFHPSQVRLGNQLFPVPDVLYLESQDKKVIAHFRKGDTIEWTAKLSDVEHSLIGAQFLRCHRSYIINMDAVNSIISGSFQLSNGTKVPIRRQNVKEITNHYYRYITR